MTSPTVAARKEVLVTTFIIIAVIVLVVVAVAAYLMRQKSRESKIEKADELRTEAATRAQSTLPPAQDKAAEAEAKAEEARATAERAKAEADEARVAASAAEADHEEQVRAADKLDPRVKHKAKDYSPQVGGTVDQQPTPPSEVNVEADAGHEAAAHDTTAVDEVPAESGSDATTEQSTDDTAPSLPRRTPGANDMPGKPMETDGTSGGWFTRKDSDQS